MRRLRERLGAEDGIAMVLVVFGIALLATLSVVIIETVTAESARSAQSVTKQSSFEAAEAGLDDYIAKLSEDRSYYVHYVHPAESTRRDDGSGGTSNLVSSSGASPAPSSWCRDANAKPAPMAWNYGATWIASPNGKDHWCSLGNGFEYNLQITPPGPTQPGVTILSTGRKIGNPKDTRIVQAIVKQSTIADFQRIVDGNVSWGSGATTTGPIYANGNVVHAGTAYGNAYATGCVGSSTCSGTVDFQGGAMGFDGSSSTSAYSDLYSPPSPLTNPINFNSFLTSFTDIASAASNSGIYLSQTSVIANGVTIATSSRSSHWLTLNSNGTISVSGCTGGSIDTTNPSATCTTIPGSPFAVPSNGAIYSNQSVIVQGTLKGRVTIAAENNIVIGNNIFYDGDGGSFATPSFGVNVLGLEAKNDVITASWAPLDLDWRAAVLAQAGTWKSSGSGPSCSSSPNTMNHRGSSATADGGAFSGRYCNRNYVWDDSLQYLSPPWFPTIDPSYTITMFRELPAS